MHPILFKIPGIGFPVRSFGVLVMTGFLVGNFVMTRLAARYGDDPKGDPERFSKVAMWILVGVLIGARLLYVVVEMLRHSETGRGYLDNPITVLAIWQGGLVMYGGLFGGIVAGIWCGKRLGLNLARGLDIGLTAGFLALSIGRIGCLMVGDDYGSVVPEHLAHLPFPITIHVPAELPEGSLFGQENAGKVLWATEIWMSANALVLGILGLWMLPRRRYGGQVSLWLVFLYAITRGTIEVFRGDDVRGVWFGGALSTSQIVSLAVGVVALVLLVRNRGRTDPERPSATAGSP